MLPIVPSLKSRVLACFLTIGSCVGLHSAARASIDEPTSISPAPGGGYLISGETRTVDYPQSYFLAKIRENGSLASEFGRNGTISFDFVDATSITSANHAVDAAGRILLYLSGTKEDGGGGEIPFAELHCFDGNGRLDPDFGDQGIYRLPEEYDVEEILLVTEGAGGKILIVARTPPVSNAVFIQLDTDGVPDATFGTNGRVTVSPSFSSPNFAMRLIDGRILLSSFFNGVVVVQQNGSVDGTFANPKMQLFQSARAIGQQADGKILIGEALSTGPAPTTRIHRFSLTGSLDPAFGTSGTAEPTPPFRIMNLVEVSPGKIWVTARSLITGNQSATWIHQLDSSGVFDEVFGSVDSRGGREPVMTASRPLYDLLISVLPAASGGPLILSNQITATFYDGFRVSRLSAEGELDQSFAGGAAVIDSSFPKPLLSYLPIERGNGFAGEFRVPVSQSIKTFRAEKGRKKRYLLNAAECGVGPRNYRVPFEANSEDAAKLRVIYAGGGQLFGVPDEGAQFNLGTKGTINDFRPYRTAKLIAQITRSPRGSGTSYAQLMLKESTSGVNSSLKFRIVNPR